MAETNTFAKLDEDRCEALREAGYAEMLFLGIVAENVHALPDGVIRAAYQPVIETHVRLAKAEAALRASR